MLDRLFNKSEKDLNHSVLVVEENGPIADLIVKLLEEAGYTAHTAASAEQALTLLDQIPLPAVFIVNGTLADISGSQFIENARLRFGRVKLSPILLLSAAQEGEATANAIQAEDYLPLPFKNQDLLDHVHKLIENASSVENTTIQ